MEPSNALPRWRGFNLPTEKFRSGGAGGFEEEDFEIMADWGFDFARLSVSYLAWVPKDQPDRLDEAVLAEIDRGIEFARSHGIHACLAFHRIAGFRPGSRQGNLWKDPAAADRAARHWAMMAERYAQITPEKLSFNLWNEPEEPSPEKMTRDDHERVARLVVEAIRAVDADRLIILDGMHWGTKPLTELADLADRNVHQSCRGYYPCEISHYKAAWNNPDVYPVPNWPLHWPEHDAKLREWYKTNKSINLAPNGSDRSGVERFYQPWVELMRGGPSTALRAGVGVHCGETGSYNHTPHDVAIAWLGDVLDVLTELNIGYALWNLRGPFGVLDSQRDDVQYEDFRGHALDREMLELLKRH